MTTQSPTNSLGRAAVIGGLGLLGGDLVKFLSGFSEVVGVDKENYDEHRGEHFDVLVNANGNSKRFWADEHPLEDFEASTLSVYRTLEDFRFRKYIYISSSDVYNDHTNPGTAREDAALEPDKLPPYGFHKFLGELIVRSKADDFLILRSSMLLGTALRKGPLFDIMNRRPLLVAKNSRIQMISTRAMADVILALCKRGLSRDIFNVGGLGTVSFHDIEKTVTLPVAVDPKAERQEYEMDVSKLGALIPLRTSEEYMKDFLVRANIYAGVR